MPFDFRSRSLDTKRALCQKIPKEPSDVSEIIFICDNDYGTHPNGPLKIS